MKHSQIPLEKIKLEKNNKLFSLNFLISQCPMSYKSFQENRPDIYIIDFRLEDYYKYSKKHTLTYVYYMSSLEP